MNLKFPFTVSTSIIPVIEFTLDNGAKGHALLDTGSESTLFDSTFVKSNKKCFELSFPKEKFAMIGIESNSQQPRVFAKTTIAFQKDSKEHKPCLISDGVVIDLSNLNARLEEVQADFRLAAIIGSNTFRKWKAVIDYEQKAMIIQDDLCTE